MVMLDNIANSEGAQKTTRDAFLGGKIEILQPSGKGHRAGLDAILIAASLPQKISGTVADLGSGSGIAGLASIALRPDLKTMLVENNPLMAQLAFQTSKLAKNSALSARIHVLEADVTLSGAKRESAGLITNSCDYVILNPPYNDRGSNRASSDLMRADAHLMGEGGLDAWMRTATSILKPRGMLVMIYRSQSIGQIIAATQGRFGGLTIMPIYSRANEPAKRLLIRATKGSKAPIIFAPALIVHNNDGSFTPEADAVLKGTAFLF